MRQEKGISLISLLIGTVISMIGVLATLSLYKSLIKNTAETVTAAQQEGQISTSILALSKELSSAGFRVTSPTQALQLNDSTTPTALTWFYQSLDELGATHSHCRGLRAEESKVSYFYADDTDCSGVGDIVDVETVTDTASSPWNEFTLMTLSGISISRSTGCQPYRQPGITIEDAPLITLTATHTIDDTDNSSEKLTTAYQICLVNLGSISNSDATENSDEVSDEEGANTNAQ